MSLRNSLLQIAAQWPKYLAKKRVDKTDAVYELVDRTLPDDLRSALDNTEHLIFHGSTGLGNITAAPWIATFDERITDSATSGYYLVYLYSTDLKRLVLCFGLGATQFNTAFPKKSEAYAAMEAAKSRLIDLVDRHLSGELRDRAKTGLLDLSAKKSQKLHRDYEHANIYHVAYELASMPSDDELVSDYRSFVDFMRVVVSDPLTPNSLALLQATTDVVTRGSEATAGEFEPRRARTKSSGSSTSGYGYSRQAKVTGDKGELVVLEYERRRLIEAGRSDLADQIVHEEAEGNRPGWDISSFEVNGDTIYIEVKAVSGGSVTAIELTQNEWKAAKNPANSDKYRIYIVTKAFSPKPKIEILADPASYVTAGKLEIRPVRFVLDLRQTRQQ